GAWTQNDCPGSRARSRARASIGSGSIRVSRIVLVRVARLFADAAQALQMAVVAGIATQGLYAGIALQELLGKQPGGSLPVILQFLPLRCGELVFRGEIDARADAGARTDAAVAGFFHVDPGIQQRGHRLGILARLFQSLEIE